MNARSFSLFLCLVPLACEGNNPALKLELTNPSAQVFQGSGGALGLGVSYRVSGLEDDQDLVVDRQCQGRVCGDPAVTEPGPCAVDGATLDPGTALPVEWDGQYFPRVSDPWGECLGPAQRVPKSTVQVTVCGRLTGEGVRLAELRCETRDVDPSAQDGAVIFTVPGVRAQQP